jgi:hypothetical protein
MQGSQRWDWQDTQEKTQAHTGEEGYKVPNCTQSMPQGMGRGGCGGPGGEKVLVKCECPGLQRWGRLPLDCRPRGGGGAKLSCSDLPVSLSEAKWRRGPQEGVDRTATAPSLWHG